MARTLDVSTGLHLPLETVTESLGIPYTHVMHAYQVVGCRHPNWIIAAQAWQIYRDLVEALHLEVETKVQMIERLGEDRIASGRVVS